MAPEGHLHDNRNIERRVKKYIRRSVKKYRKSGKNDGCTNKMRDMSKVLIYLIDCGSTPEKVPLTPGSEA